MSFQLDQERNGKVPEIEMPPLPIEQQQEQPEPQVAQETEQEQVTENVVEQAPIIKDNSKENNLRVLREKADRLERIERERNELEKRLQAYEQNKNNFVQEEPDINIAPDDFVEGKHLNKYDKKIEKLQKQLQAQEQQNHLTATEIKLRNEFADFDKVVSVENIEQLRTYYPEIANTLNMSTADLYSKAKSAYNMIKKLGIVQEDTFQPDKLKAQQNMSKPRPLTSISPQQGDSPLTKANVFAHGLTDELKSQLRKEMESARKNL